MGDEFGKKLEGSLGDKLGSEEVKKGDLVEIITKKGADNDYGHVTGGSDMQDSPGDVHTGYFSDYDKGDDYEGITISPYKPASGNMGDKDKGSETYIDADSIYEIKNRDKK